MATFKIKAEDKAAFINKLEKLGIEVDTQNMKNGTETRGGKTIKWFTFDVPNPDDVKQIKAMLRQSPAITKLKELKTNTTKKMKNNNLTKSELKEMILQELKEKKKVEDKKKTLDEAVGGLDDPNFIAGVAALLGVGTAILTPFIKALKSAKSPEEKAQIKNDLKKAISGKMSGGL